MAICPSRRLTPFCLLASAPPCAQLQYLEAADVVAVLREGRVAELGTYAELAARGVDFHQLAVTDSAEEEGTEGEAEGEEGAATPAA